MKTCKHCQTKVLGPHYCHIKRRIISDESKDDFLISAAVGFALDNAILGGVLGGDMIGGLVGDLLTDGELF